MKNVTIASRTKREGFEYLNFNMFRYNIKNQDKALKDNELLIYLAKRYNGEAYFLEFVNPTVKNNEYVGELAKIPVVKRKLKVSI